MNCLKLFSVTSICLILFACSTESNRQTISESKNVTILNTENKNIEKTNINARNDLSAIEQKDDSELSPSEVFRKFDKAIHDRNSEKIKRYISKDAIDFFEEEANQKGITFKELIEQTPIQETIEGMPEIKSEKVEGNNAVVEAKVNPSANFEKLPFIKESGVWKYAFDKFIKQAENERIKIEQVRH